MNLFQQAEQIQRKGELRSLIIHADDLGMAHSVNEAIFACIESQRISSASVMIPCPCFAEVAMFAQSHPEIDLGVHATLTSEFSTYRWRPIAPLRFVRSLVDSEGFFWKDSQIAARRARCEEVEIELRAQIERAFEAGLRPSHLDSHMFVLFRTPELFMTLVRVAQDYGLSYLAAWRDAPAPMLELLENAPEEDIIADKIVMADDTLTVADLPGWYRNTIRNLAPGLTQLIVHPGFNNDELSSITGNQVSFGSAWRQQDFDVILSHEFEYLLQAENIYIVNWRILRNSAKMKSFCAG